MTETELAVVLVDATEGKAIPGARVLEVAAFFEAALADAADAIEKALETHRKADVLIAKVDQVRATLQQGPRRHAVGGGRTRRGRR